jgi:hypothetical protein
MGKVGGFVVGGMLAVLASACLGVVPVYADSDERAWWRIVSRLSPSRLKPGQEGHLIVEAIDLGAASINAGKVPVTITDTLPAGLEATAVEGPGCSAVLPAKSVTCELVGDEEPIQPYQQLGLNLTVTMAKAGGSGGEATVSGGESFVCQKVRAGEGEFPSPYCQEFPPTGGGPFPSPGSGEFDGKFANEPLQPVSVQQPAAVEGEPVPFGVETFRMSAENEAGEADAQAGSHPFQLTSVLALNQTENPSEPPASVKDLSIKLPPGLIANPTAFPQCTEAEFSSTFRNDVNECPPETAIGVAVARVFPGEKKTDEVITRTVPVFNLVPAKGEPLRFGFDVESVPVVLDTSIRTGEDYGGTVTIDNLSQAANFLSSVVTIWGSPSDPRHRLARGWACLNGNEEFETTGACQLTSVARSPLLTLPTSCSGRPLEVTVEGSSWSNGSQKPSIPLPKENELSDMEGLDGCNQLTAFTPSISVAPDVQRASTPTGLTVKLHVSQEADFNPEGLAAPAVKDVTVALPDGVTTNPAGAGGLESCSESQIGYLPPPASTPPEELHFTSTLPSQFCATASKIGTVKITTPFLPDPLEGAVYLASQNANPFGSLVAIYIVAEDPTAGVLVKVPGEITLNPETGQLVTRVRNSPQLPFEEAEFHFFGGERAPLATPSRCQTYETTASLTPWSGNAPVPASSSFAITAGPDGSPSDCPGATLPFAPSLNAGTTNLQAGAFSTLTANVSREDGQQSIKAVQVQLPPGVSGLLPGIKLCEEAQANAGTCGPESLIGETTVSAGLGGEPYTVTGGKLYLTGPYEGAPFGVSVTSPVKAGPFDLEHDTSNPGQQPACDCLVVRGKVEINPLTAVLTVTTNSSGPYAIPQVIDGIPVQIKHINVTSTRQRFAFNPTNCNPLAITGNIAGGEGASSSLSVPFQVANCATLGFSPKVGVSTKGKASKANGANLLIKIAYPKGAMGSQSNLNEVKFDIPKQLPVRLTTIQKACLASVFEADRAACPAQSQIGHAIVHTPVLPVPLEGSVYFVSYGNKKFPEAVLVLKGYGVTIEQHCETFIDHKTGITSATCASIPDVPVESVEVNLPTGSFSEFTANLPAKDHYNLCGHKLTMPTLFKASNGAEIHETTKIAVTGCPKPKPPKHKKAKKAVRGRRAKRR